MTSLLAAGTPALGQQGPAAQVIRPEPAIEPGHLALAREVMLSSGIAPAFDAVVPAVSDQIKKLAVTRPELAKALDEVLATIKPEMEQHKQRMIDNAARIYAKALGEQDLRDVVAFLHTPAGQRYAATQTALADDLAGALQDWTQDLSDDIMTRVRAELAQRGHTIP